MLARTSSTAIYWHLVVCLVAWSVTLTSSHHDSKRLLSDLLRRKTRMMRPVDHNSDRLTVKMMLKLTQLLDVDEKNEIITTNVWVIHEWQDFSLRWDPAEYGNVHFLNIPSESLWLPDVVLYNNADGDYVVTIKTKAKLNYDGKVTWAPPAIYKSHCDINVKFFPFDEQECNLKFGSWSYDGYQVDLRHFQTEELEEIEDGVELKEYYPSVEWDLMRASAKKTNIYYPCCVEPFPDVTFKLKIRRKTLFYTINLMIPCISINLLTILAFYLPSDSGEKISLCISLLLSLSIFQLLLIDLVPATSISIPLLGKYIIFTMVLVSLSVFISVVTLNVNYRSASTHELPAMTKYIFLKVLPQLLCMQRPDLDPKPLESEELVQAEASGGNGGDSWSARRLQGAESDLGNRTDNYVVSSTFIGSEDAFRNADLSNFCDACAQRGSSRYPPHIKKALDGSIFIARHMREENSALKVKDDWKCIALVIDRLFFWIYLTVCLVGTLGILLQPPMLYDQREPLDTTYPLLGVQPPVVARNEVALN